MAHSVYHDSICILQQVFQVMQKFPIFCLNLKWDNISFQLIWVAYFQLVPLLMPRSVEFYGTNVHEKSMEIPRDFHWILLTFGVMKGTWAVWALVTWNSMAFSMESHTIIRNVIHLTPQGQPNWEMSQNMLSCLIRVWSVWYLAFPMHHTLMILLKRPRLKASPRWIWDPYPFPVWWLWENIILSSSSNRRCDPFIIV